LAIRVDFFFFLLAASQNKNPQLFGTTAASTRSETKDERYNNKKSFLFIFFVIGLFCRDDQVSFGPAAVPPHCWVIPGQRISLVVVVFFAAPFFYFNQISPFYILRFACRRNARKTLRLLLPSYDIIMPSVVVAVAV
jgi:hypothetical protein